MIELTILSLELFWMNYNSVFRSYDCVFNDKIVLFERHKLQLFVEESQCYRT